MGLPGGGVHAAGLRGPVQQSALLERGEGRGARAGRHVGHLGPRRQCRADRRVQAALRALAAAGGLPDEHRLGHPPRAQLRDLNVCLCVCKRARAYRRARARVDFDGRICRDSFFFSFLASMLSRTLVL